MVHCPAAVCAIYPVWKLPALYPVIDEACTQVFHFHLLKVKKHLQILHHPVYQLLFRTNSHN